MIKGKGIPIGNLTSQLFANVYLNELDQFVKHELRVKRYARYTDDFIIVSFDRAHLESLRAPIERFLMECLTLTLHPDKISIRKYRQGIDFLGYVVLPHYRVLRAKTRRRMVRVLARLAESVSGEAAKVRFQATFASYLGVLSHANTHRLRGSLLNRFGGILGK